MTNPLTGGFRIRHSKLADTLPLMQAFRAEMLNVVEDLSASAVARESTIRFDSMLLSDETEPDGSPMAGLYSVQWDMEHKHRHAPIGSWPGDWRANMVVIPYQGDIIGIFQAGQPDWQDLWRSIEGVEAFDLTPGSAPADELESRRGVWATLLGEDLSARVQMVGLEKTIHHGNGPVHSDHHIAQFCPAFEWRVDMQACAQLGIDPENADRGSDAYRSHHDRIAAILPHELTAEMLLLGPKRPAKVDTPISGAPA